jgi:hypothetical protein
VDSLAVRMQHSSASAWPSASLRDESYVEVKWRLVAVPALLSLRPAALQSLLLPAGAGSGAGTSTGNTGAGDGRASL